MFNTHFRIALSLAIAGTILMSGTALASTPEPPPNISDRLSQFNAAPQFTGQSHQDQARANFVNAGKGFNTAPQAAHNDAQTNAVVASAIVGAMDPDSSKLTTYSGNRLPADARQIAVVVQVNDAPDGALLQGSWVAVDIGDVLPLETEIAQSEETVSGSTEVQFNLTAKTRFPAGTYRVAISLDGELQGSLEYSVGDDTAPAQTAVGTDALSTYSNPVAPFEVQYPADWSVKENGQSVAFSAASGMPQVWVDYAVADSDDIAQRMMDATVQALKTVDKKLKAGKLRRNKDGSLETELSLSNGKTSFQAVVRGVSGGGYGYSITFIGLAKGFAQQRPLARTLLNTFKPIRVASDETSAGEQASTSQPVAATSDNGLTYYTHMQANFGISYPKGWEVQEYDNAVDFRSGEGYFVEVDWISANVLGERSLAQYVLERAQDRVSHDSNAVVSQPKTNPNGSVTIEMEFLSGGQPMHYRVQSLKGEGGLLYTVTFADSASGYAQHRALAIEMMNSFGEAKG